MRHVGIIRGQPCYSLRSGMAVDVQIDGILQQGRLPLSRGRRSKGNQRIPQHEDDLR